MAYMHCADKRRKREERKRKRQWETVSFQLTKKVKDDGVEISVSLCRACEQSQEVNGSRCSVFILGIKKGTYIAE